MKYAHYSSHVRNPYKRDRLQENDAVVRSLQTLSGKNCQGPEPNDAVGIRTEINRVRTYGNLPHIHKFGPTFGPRMQPVRAR